MNIVNFNERACERYRRFFDAYLDNELLVETNQDVLQHLTSCAECSRIIEGRSRIKHSVRDAVNREQAPPEFAAALRSRIRTERPGFFAHDTVRWAMAAAAVLVLAVAGAGALRWGRVLQFGSDEGLVQTVSAGVQNLLRVGLIDHVHCAILAKRWQRKVSMDDMKAATGRQALGPEFVELAPVVEAKLGAKYKLVQGHRCVANRRQYIHFILTGENGAIVSVVITAKNNESFSRADAAAVMEASGIPIYRDRQGVLEMAGFESDRYLAYIVSNLDREENLNVAAVMAPIVQDHLRKLEL